MLERLCFAAYTPAQFYIAAPDFIHYTSFFLSAQSAEAGKLLQFYFISISLKDGICTKRQQGKKSGGFPILRKTARICRYRYFFLKSAGLSADK